LRRLACIAVLALTALAPPADAAVVPDDARESRWADEVVPQLVVGDAVWLATPQRARVLALFTQPDGTRKGSVIVVHGAGVHPDWGLIGELRSRLADRGFATLSVQMPVLAADAATDDYPPLFPVAADRLEAAVAWLRAHGATRIAVVSHSLGAAMVDAWLARAAHAPIDGWVPIGMQVPFTRPPTLPVLDVTAQRDSAGALEHAPRRRDELPRDPCSAAVRLPGTDHFLAGALPAAVNRIAPFLEQVFAGRC
jgi:hypothetical protein